MTMASPFILNTDPVVRRADGRRARGTTRGLRRSRRGGQRTQRGVADGRSASAPRWDDLRDRRVGRPPRADRAAPGRRRRASAASTPLDVLLDLALDEPDLGLRVRAVLANDDDDEVAKLLLDDALHARAVRRRRPRRASSATRRRPPTSSATGCATASCMPIEQAVHKLTERAGGHVRLRRTAASSRGAWRRRRGVRSRHRRPRAAAAGPRLPRRRASASPPTSPSACRHVLVNGTPDPGRRRARRRSPPGTASEACVTEATEGGAGRHRMPSSWRAWARCRSARRSWRTWART